MDSTNHNTEDSPSIRSSADENTSQIPDIDNIRYTGDTDVGNVQQIVFSASKTEISSGPHLHYLFLPIMKELLIWYFL